ncbi:transposase [Peredibacter sp. HCB2-198]|uniref:transposase n=1 Tax=Peredibacter sp. HCB2-198 TaxID=3383025 RepID=UPI0038B50FD3
MVRPYFIKSENHPYHVVARTSDREFFPLSLDEVWMIFMDELKRVHVDYQLCIHAFVLMGNHFHLLCHTPKGNLDQIMHTLMRNTSVRIKRRSRSRDPIWDGRYKWSLIESQTHYYQVYRYIFQNPLRVKIVSKVQDYPFSSLHPVSFPLHSFIPLLFGGHEGEYIWLNETLDREAEALIKLGLKKQYFSINKRKQKIFNKLLLE